MTALNLLLLTDNGLLFIHIYSLLYFGMVLEMLKKTMITAVYSLWDEKGKNSDKAF